MSNQCISLPAGQHLWSKEQGHGALPRAWCASQQVHECTHHQGLSHKA
jgi:hypothetical protein